MTCIIWMATALLYMKAVKHLNKEPYVHSDAYVFITVLNANIQKVKTKLILTREHKTCGKFSKQTPFSKQRTDR